MATSTQRMLILVLALNLVITMALIGDSTPDGITNENALQWITQDGKNIADTMNKQSSYVNPSQVETEGTFGDSLSLGGGIYRTLIKGLEPLPFNRDEYSGDPVLSTFVWFLLMFRILMYYLLITEVYSFFKNRKAS